MNDIKFLKSILNYDPESGVLSWREREDVPKWWNTRYAGKQPTNTDKLGYLRVKISYKEWSGYVSVHRVCFLLHYGYLPDMVDHINGDIKDNRASNLRATDPQKNAWNRKGNDGTRTGYKGVHAIKDRNGGFCGYTAHIGHKGEREYLGFFKTAEEAGAAYYDREQSLRGSYVRDYR
jgi:hypothetical protein